MNRIVRTLVIGIALLIMPSLLVLGGSVTARHEAPMAPAGLFDTTGGAAASVGCAQWDVPEADPGPDYDGDNQDFVIGANRVDLFMIVIHDGHQYLISGKQCGVVLDWRRFPEKARPTDLKQ